jgi:hypothetical protein
MSRDNILVEYEKRIKELNSEIGRLRLELSRSKRQGISVSEPRVGDEYTPKAIEIDAVDAYYKPTVANGYYKSFDQSYSVNTKLDWSSMTIYCLKYCPSSLNDSKAKSKDFLMGNSSPSGYDTYTFFRCYGKVIPKNYDRNDLTKEYAQGSIVDVNYGAVYSAIAYYEKVSDLPVLDIIYRSKSLIVQVKARPKLYFHLGDKTTKCDNLGSVMHTNSQHQMFYVSTMNHIMVVAAKNPKQQIKATPSKEEIHVAASALGSPVQQLFIDKDIIYVGLLDGSLHCYSSLKGRPVGDPCLLNKDVITTMHVAHDTIMLGTTRQLQNGDSELAICVLRTQGSGFRRLVHTVNADFFISCRVLKLTIQNREKIVLVAVPRSYGGTLCFFDFSDNNLLWITDKEDWWSERRVNGLCQVNNSLLVYGENKDQNENRADLKTIACINFN